MKEDKYFWTAILLYIAECILLGYMKYKMYGNAIDTLFFNFLFIPPAVACIREMRADKIAADRANPKKVKRGKIIDWILVVILAVSLGYLLVNDIDYIFQFSFFLFIAIGVVLLVAFAIPKFRKQINSEYTPANISFLFGVFLVVTIMYNVVVNPCTVKEAAVVLAQNGYTEITYRRSEDKYIYKYFEGDSEVTIVNKLNKYEDALDFYKFEAEKEGQLHRILVSVKTGRLIGYYVVDTEYTND